MFPRLAEARLGRGYLSRIATTTCYHHSHGNSHNLPSSLLARPSASNTRHRPRQLRRSVECLQLCKFSKAPLHLRRNKRCFGEVNNTPGRAFRRLHSLPGRYDPAFGWKAFDFGSPNLALSRRPRLLWTLEYCLKTSQVHQCSTRFDRKNIQQKESSRLRCVVSSMGNAVVNPGVFESEISNSPSQCTRQCALTWLLHICCAMRSLDQLVPLARCILQHQSSKRDTACRQFALGSRPKCRLSPSPEKQNWDNRNANSQYVKSTHS